MRNNNFLILLVLMGSFISTGQRTNAGSKITPAAKQRRPLTRKFSTAQLFQNLSNTCTQAGNVAAAQTQEQKQQAACNLLASVFQTAADLSQKHQKRSLSPAGFDEAPAEFTLDLFHALDVDPGKAANLVDLPVTKELAGLPSDDARRLFLTSLLASEEGTAAVAQEASVMFETLIAVKLPEILTGFSTIFTAQTVEEK